MPDDDHKIAIDRFLSNESDYVEAENIYDYLKKNVENLDSVDLCDHIEDGDIVRTSQSFKDKLLFKILRNRSRVRTITYKMLAAASIIGLLFFTARYFYKQGSIKEKAFEAVASYTIKNTTKSLMNYVLPDSSKIFLQPGAVVVYQAGFREKRDITVMAGDIYFKVSKNQNHPFVVSVNGIQVVALGTEFWVQNQRNNQVVSISLHEGKVRITPADKGFKMDTVYLTPGYTCTIDKITGKVWVSLSNPKNTSGNQAITVTENKQSKAKSTIIWTGSEIQFYNAPLENLLRKIENRYQVKIVSDTAISTMYLTGKIYHTDSIHTILKTICELNNMSYEQSNDTIFLKKTN